MGSTVLPGFVITLNLNAVNFLTDEKEDKFVINLIFEFLKLIAVQTMSYIFRYIS